MTELLIDIEKYFDTAEYQKAIAFLEKNIAINPEEITNYWYLGLAYLLLGETETAEEIWMSVLLEIDNLQYHNYLSGLLKILDKEGVNQYQKRNLSLAINVYQKISEILSNEEIFEQEYGLYYYHFALILEEINQTNLAKETYQKALEINPNLIDAYNNLGNIFLNVGNFSQAEDIYQQAIAVNSQHWGAYFNLLLVLNIQGKTEEAIKFAQETSSKFPDSLLWQLKAHLTLPYIYENQEEIYLYRKNFEQGLKKIIANLDITNHKQNYLESLSKHNNFYLAYQGLNDLDLQQKYGQLVHNIMKANYPELTIPLPIPTIEKNDKIKIGYISNCFRNHTVGKLAIGWFKNHNREKFDIYCYYLDSPIDELTKEFQNYSNYFYQLPSHLEIIAQKIKDNNLHILVFLDIGMYPEITQLASLSLAPIQCTTWLHPVTSGLATIDYFLSSDLMEVKNAENYYSEKLIRLPNLGICYAKPILPKQSLTRADFNLKEDSIIYLCTQFLPKYLPQYDYILPNIAQKVTNAKFVFISHNSQYITEKFKKRLAKEFEKINFNIDDYCIFLNRMKKEQYLQLNFLSDVYLDTFSWSGGHTTLEAIACNLPVVTCPSELMRGRHSYAIMKMLGVEETIASNEKEYLEIAIKLGNNTYWRQDLINKIKICQHKVFNDLNTLIDLEKFFQKLLI